MILEPIKNEVCHCFYCFPIYLPWSDGTQHFWMLSFKPTFSLSSFTFIKRLFSSLCSTPRVVSSAYLKLLIFLPAILIPACPSSSLAFLIMYSAYKLNKQGDNIQSLYTPFLDLEPVYCSISSNNCFFLTCIQISLEAGQVVWYSHLFKNFPQFVVIHTVKGFDVVNKAEVDIFLELSCFLDDPGDAGNLISETSDLSKSNLNIWKFTYYWTLAWRILSITLLVCEMNATA